MVATRTVRQGGDDHFFFQLHRTAPTSLNWYKRIHQSRREVCAMEPTRSWEKVYWRENYAMGWGFIDAIICKKLYQKTRTPIIPGEKTLGRNDLWWVLEMSGVKFWVVTAARSVASLIRGDAPIIAADIFRLHISSCTQQQSRMGFHVTRKDQ